MNKNKLLCCASIAFCLSIAGCGSNTSSSTLSSEKSSDMTSDEPIVNISEEEKAKPESTSFEYNDYGDTDEKHFDTSKWYKNFTFDLPLPDPFVVEKDDTYYIYGTTDRTGAQCFDCFSTKDFNSFELHTGVYTPDGTTVTKHTLFAPEIYLIGDTYYMYYSGKSDIDPQGGINVLTSKSPAGPFKEYVGKDADGNDVNYHDKVMIKDIKTGLHLSILDQTILVDDDGKIYLYYSVYDTGVMQYIVGLEMKDPVTPNWDTYKILLRPGEPTPKTNSTNIFSWECMQSFKVAEGPCVIKSPVNGKYYMTYSVNHYPDRFYTVCYAESETPLGDYTKPYFKGGYWTNLLFGFAGPNNSTVYKQWEGFQSGTAHHTIFKAGDEYMIAYHSHRNKKDSNNGRLVCFDHIYFDKDGVPRAQGPSDSIQYLPSKVSGYRNIASLATVYVENITNPEALTDNFVTEHYNLSQEQDREALLGKGKSYVKMVFDKKYKIGGLQIVNSAFFDYYLNTVSFIKLSDTAVILDGHFQEDLYVDVAKEFIHPDATFTFDFEDVETDTIIFGFDTEYYTMQINELIVLAEVE